jgi:CBS domain-containing protein
MKVRDILNQKGNDIYTIKSYETVFDAIKKMADYKIGALLVVDDNQIQGIISERDYRDKVVLMGRQSKSTPVKDIMSRQVFCIKPDDDIQLCMKLMTVKRIRHLPVLDENELAGVISIGDVVKAVIDEQKVEIDSLRNYISGGYPG